MSARRVTAAQLAAIARQLTPNDRAVVAMLATVKMASGNQLRRATSGDNSLVGQRAFRRQLERLVRWRVVARLERRQGGLGSGSDSWTYALDVVGQRFYDETGARRPRLPGRPMWAHAMAGAEIYCRLAEATRSTGETFAWQGEPDCWRTFSGGIGETVKLKPDALVTVAGSNFVDVSFLEVDQSTQSRTVIRAKLRSYLRYAATGEFQAINDGLFPLTVFITTTPGRHALLVDLVGELSPDEWSYFAVGLPSDAVRLLSGGES